MHMEIFNEQPRTAANASNPVSVLAPQFVYVEHPVVLANLPENSGQKLVHISHPLLVPLGFVSSPLGDVCGLVASLPGDYRHSHYIGLAPLIVLLQMTSGDPHAVSRRTECTSLFRMSQYSRQTQPTEATLPNHPAGDRQTPEDSVQCWHSSVPSVHQCVGEKLLTTFDQSPTDYTSVAKRLMQILCPDLN